MDGDARAHKRYRSGAFGTVIFKVRTDQPFRNLPLRDKPYPTSVSAMAEDQTA
jgi:hypothetical protein